ncbi:hypothetical protein H7K24_21850 [Mycobacterium fragae]|nr:hypothetical protein [Mycobacterium fragae]
MQVALAWQNFGGQNNNPASGALSLGDVQVSPLPVDTRTARMDLTFSLGERWSESGEPASGALSLGDVQVSPLPVDTRTARMDLTFSLGERWSESGEPAGIQLEVEFRTDVFDAASIEALIERLQRVVVALSADPARRLSAVDVWRWSFAPMCSMRPVSRR